MVSILKSGGPTVWSDGFPLPPLIEQLSRSKASDASNASKTSDVKTNPLILPGWIKSHAPPVSTATKNKKSESENKQGKIKNAESAADVKKPKIVKTKTGEIAVVHPFISRVLRYLILGVDDSTAIAPSGPITNQKLRSINEKTEVAAAALNRLELLCYGSSEQSIDSLRPDFVLIDAPNHSPSKYNIALILEVKNDTGCDFSHEDEGQTVEYGQRILLAQPYRSFVFTVLLSQRIIRVLKISRLSQPVTLTGPDHQTTLTSCSVHGYQTTELNSVSGLSVLKSLLLADMSELGVPIGSLDFLSGGSDTTTGSGGSGGSTGSSVGRFRITGVCGRGASGTVFRVHPSGDVNVKDDVALKIITDAVLFAREVKTLTALKQP